MPTNSIKHAMYQLAKKVANKEYKDIIESVRDLGTLDIMEYIIPAALVRKEEINSILKEHPEFDGGVFREMIKEIQIRNKQNESSS